MNSQASFFVKENQKFCTSLRDLVKDTLLRDRDEKARYPTAIEPMTSRVLLLRRVFYCCAAIAAQVFKVDK